MPPVSDCMEKSYDPGPLETKWRTFWLERGKSQDGGGRGDAPVFSIVMPPPNVTGSLHIGHALNCTLQDVLVRYKKMRGFDVLWIPGTDHAGIATQMVVERELLKEGVSRESLGKERFIEKIWEFKEKSSGRIFEQINRLGFIPDWNSQRFTMDEGFTEAVKEVFVELYRKNLIRRDNRLVNYDPGLKTAVSDLEVEQKEVSGRYWHIRYPAAGGGDIVVATTRPETMFGDTAVAVHPEDKRYVHLIGTEVEIPLAGRSVPVIADEYSDPEKGSGAVKITPAHDFNDFEVGKRHNLPLVSIFDGDARLNKNAPEPYRGLDRFEARKKLLKDLEHGGFLVKTENISHTVPYGDRSGSVIEPMLMEQWYMDVKQLAAAAADSVRKGGMNFHPKFWERTYFQWLENIEPWCISRQLWWGHGIPAWYGPDGAVFVEKDGDEAAKSAFSHYGKQVELTRDPNVLDTWFSSALWPFVTMGWPRKNGLLSRYYPTSVLITGFDIIFFWVARMAMMGLEFTDNSPFKDIYIHGLVRDSKGEKMSKTKGNVIDPLEVADRFGADTLRFCLCALTSGGRDIEISMSTIKGYRNFMNKIWNASRFILETRRAERFSAAVPPAPEKCDKWILARLNMSLEKIDMYMENYEFGKAAQEAYRFFWRDLCDRYIEASKISIGESDSRTSDVLAYVLRCSVRALHPFCPHLTEEINQRVRAAMGLDEMSLLDEEYPRSETKIIGEFAEDHIRMQFVFEGVIDEIRAARGAADIKISEKVRVAFLTESGKDGENVKEIIESEIAVINKLAGVLSHEFCKDPDEFSAAPGLSRSVSFACGDPSKRFNIKLKVEPGQKAAVTQNAEAIRKDFEDVSKKLLECESKLSDPLFQKNAPEKVINKEKGKRHEFLRRKEVLESELKKLSGGEKPVNRQTDSSGRGKG
ncbi:MAG: valine--tRNA ligase [Candidatus Dadabacteria bacterium]|nr:valine--tRNA ligase [Candidatus Dadabacteria bacterium]